MQEHEQWLKIARDDLKAAKVLNPFSTKFRYPSEYDIPDFADAEFSIKQAQKIVTFTTKKVVPPSTGQSRIF